uniref:Uncharacterized protein n=1 Tax=Trypanosoma congolense (strain IL3000) TaxID=1068625 RepID=G0UXV2_TRYCI|nr:conserved hypothetical protein [Trypanosoma congolense IL3000]
MSSLKEKEYESEEEEDEEVIEKDNEKSDVEDKDESSVTISESNLKAGRRSVEGKRSVLPGGAASTGEKANKAPNLPQRKADVTEISMALPGLGGSVVNVAVRLSPEPPLEYFIKRKDKTKKNDDNAVEEEEERGEEEGDKEEEDQSAVGGEEGDEEGNNASSTVFPNDACPLWLRPILSDDTFYWDYTVSSMFGYTFIRASDSDTHGSAKPTHQKMSSDREDTSRSGEESKTFDVSRNPGRVDTTDDTDVDIIDDNTCEEYGSSYNASISPTAAPVMNSAIYNMFHSSSERPSLHSSPSGVFVMPAKQNPRATLCFREANRLFFIIKSLKSDRWYLLDKLPVPQSDMEEEEGYGEEEDDEDQGNGATRTHLRSDESEDEEESEEDAGGDEDGGQKSDDGHATPNTTAAAVEVVGSQWKNEESADDEDLVPDASMLDMSSVICIDTLMLAALRCPTALRCCLSQEEPASLACVEAWMKMDVEVALPIFTSIFRTMLSVRASAGSLPYKLPDWVFDYNVFFTTAYLQHRISSYPRMSPSVPSSSSQAFSALESLYTGEKQSVETMAALLKVRVLPAKSILMENLNHVIGIHMFIWLLLEIPKNILLEWAGEVSAVSNANKNDSKSEGPSDDDYDAEEEEEAVLSLRYALQYTNGIVSLFWDRTRQADNSCIVLSPFFKAVILEVRRRQAREDNGLGVSKYSLMECIAHALLQRVEDGKPKKDPLVTSSFSYSPKGHGPSLLSTPSPSGQRLYQSDLVMLLLAVTTTAVPRNTNSVTTLGGSLSIRMQSVPISQSPDGHYELLKYLLVKKAGKVRTPLEVRQSGYFRLLYLSLLRFKASSTAKLILSMSPLYSLLGPTDRCPLPQLLHVWCIERDFFCKGHLDHFIRTYWNELYYRVLEKHFDESTLVRAKQLLLLEKMAERRNAYLFAIQQLASRAPFLSPKVVCGVSGTSVEESDDVLAIASAPETHPPVSPRNFLSGRADALSRLPYSHEWCHEVEHVQFMLASLHVEARTYLTPETLYLLLFDSVRPNPYAVYYLMRECGIVTVQANPLKGVPLPVMEHALLSRHKPAVLVLLAIGEVLDDQMLGGAINGEVWLHEAFRARDAMKLLHVWRKQEDDRKADPQVKYGIIRPMPAPQ